MKENQLNAKDEKRQLGKRLKVKGSDSAKTGRAQKPDVQPAKVVPTGAKDVRKVRASKPVGRPSKASTQARTTKKASGGLQIVPVSRPAHRITTSDSFYIEDIDTVNLTKWIIAFNVALVAASLLLGFILGKLA